MSIVCASKDIIYEIGHRCFGIHPDYTMEELGFYTIVIDVPNALVEIESDYGLVCSQLPGDLKYCFPGSIAYDLKEEPIPDSDRRKVVRFFEERLEKIIDKINSLRGVPFEY